MAKRYEESFKVKIIKQHQTGISAAKLCSQYGIARSTLFLWKKQYTADEAGQIPRERYLLEMELERLRTENTILKTCGCSPASPLSERLSAIDLHRGEFGIRALCRVLQVNRSTYYHHAFRSPGKTQLQIKMSELRDKFTAARRAGKEASILNGLVRPSCLIIDEVGHCEFDKENTRLFFDLIDRRYNKEGNFNIVFTSNKHPSHWRTNFNEDDALLCALDRIFDDATVFNIKGESFREKRLETVALQTSRVKAPDSSETPTP